MPTPLRILHTENSTGWGGQEIRILTEATGMIARGHQVALITPVEAQIHAEAQRRGIPVVALPIARKRLGALLALRRWLRRHGRGFDVINTHSSTDSWLTALACRSLRGMPPIVRTRHVSTAIHPKRSNHWLYQVATRHIVTTGEALREQLARDNGFDPATMTSVRTGIDLTYFRPLDRQACRQALQVADRPTLGILATLRDWKGHDYLLDAWRDVHVRHPDWQLLVIGDGPQRPRLERRVQDEGLADVRFVGNQHDVPSWLACLDLFVLPSFGDEGVPQGIMQAMACGLAVVSTPVGAIEEAVQRDRTGLIVPPRDAVALGQALDRLMTDQALRRQFGEAGLAYAGEHFGIDVMLDAMERVFRTAIAAGGHASPPQ